MDTSSLEFLRISACPLVNIPMTHYNFLKEMKIDGGYDSLTIFSLDFFPKLRLLVLRRCQNVRRISQENAHSDLNRLIIDNCSQFESFSSMQILLPSLTELNIIKYLKVKMFPDGGLPSNVKEVSLSSFKLIASLREALDANTCLESLCIQNIEVECFPHEVLLPRYLTSLEIYDCPNLKKMKYKGLCHLSFLRLYNYSNL